MISPKKTFSAINEFPAAISDVSFAWDHLKFLYDDLTIIQEKHHTEIINIENPSSYFLTIKIVFFHDQPSTRLQLTFNFDQDLAYPSGRLDCSVKINYGSIT